MRKSRLKTLIKFYLRAGTVYVDHSPFFYTFWKEVLQPSLPRTLKLVTTSERSKLLRNTNRLQRHDLGAGSRVGNSSTIGRLAATSLSDQRMLAILHAVTAQHRHPTVLELGTSFGLSSLVMGQHENALVLTIEGDPTVAEMARALHSRHRMDNIKIMTGAFSEMLPVGLASVGDLDVVFMDGHHQGEATKAYFELFHSKLKPSSMVIVDDVLWSEDMAQSFEDLRRHPSVKASLLYMGLGFLFFEENWSQPIHLDWVDRWLKPWTYRHAL